MTAITLLTKLEQDIDLQGVPEIPVLLSRLAEIRKALEPKPKLKKPVVQSHPLKLTITENGKTNEIVFQTEKEAEKYLVLKQKERLKTAKSPKGLSVPNPQHLHSAKYREACSEYWQAAQEQNLDFRVIISRA